MAKKKILLVDDEPSILKTLQKRLEPHYDVVTATDGLEGIERALQARPDLIITDVMMPTMDGFTFLRKLRDKPQLSGIPVIVLTARDQMQDLFILEGIKSADYIVKPFDSALLLNKIAQLLERVQKHLDLPPPAP